METGRIGHHGQNVRGRVVWDIWSAIEVAVILHHSMEDWTVHLTKTNTLLYIISLVMNTTAQVWYTDLSVVHKSVTFPRPTVYIVFKVRQKISGSFVGAFLIL